MPYIRCTCPQCRPEYFEDQYTDMAKIRPKRRYKAAGKALKALTIKKRRK